MRIRIKFSKHGAVKFIGHLDIMRFFQKAIRRAQIDVAYSGGFSPHQIMSFAAPLGVGLCSNGEYLDIEVNSHQGREDMMSRLNEAMVEGIKIENIVALSDNTGNAMASVAAASYLVEWKPKAEKPQGLKESCHSFFAQKEIFVTKETKKSTMSVDLKPGIYAFEEKEEGIYLLVDASSSGNIKPALLLEAFFAYLNLPFNPNSIQITREDTFTRDKKGNLIPLDQVGENF